MPAPKVEIPNYHFGQEPDGQLAIEVGNPYDGAVTLTWRPNEFPGENTEIVFPEALFFSVVESYVRARSSEAKTKRKAETVPA